jgi:hypothetical protein
MQAAQLSYLSQILGTKERISGIHRTQDALAYGWATAEKRDAYGREPLNGVLASPETCPEGGTRRARNRVNVPGLAAVSQAIGHRKVPTYRRKPSEGRDAK